MNDYKEIKNPTKQEVLQAMSQSAYMAVLVENPEAVAQSIGDAKHLHELYNTLDEVAASKQEKLRKVPEGTYSSRLLEDGSTSELPEDVLKARERRDAKANRAIDAQVGRWWDKRGLNVAFDYPHRRLATAGVQWMNSHDFIEDDISRELHDADGRAMESNLPPVGEPSAMLLSWISALFLVSNKAIYQRMVKEWAGNVWNRDTLLFATDYPEIKTPFYRLLNDYMAYHMAHKEEASADPYYYFDGTFGAYLERNLPKEIYFPTVTFETYRRFYPDNGTNSKD